MPTTTPSAPAPCLRPPEGWRCTRKLGHAGKCTVIPTTPAAKFFVPSEALMRIKLASERAHHARHHPDAWDCCGREACVADRTYLGAHGVVNPTTGRPFK